MTRYTAMPRRYSTASDDDVTCSPDRAELWVVVESTGAVVCHCDTQDMAERVAGGMDALAAVERLEAEREACRRAACAALGTDSDTLQAAVLALIEGRAEAIEQVLGIGRAWSDDLVGGGTVIASDADVEIAREALAAAHADRVQRFEGEGIALGSERGQ